MKKPTKMSPKSAKSMKQVCRLESDNFDADGFWILHGINTISLAQQRLGEPCKESITIPKKEFDRMIEWYMREQVLDKTHQ